MIDYTMLWIKRLVDKHDLKPEKVLDIGGRNTNGSPRDFFPDSNYVGIDIEDGFGVDLVLSAYDLSKHFSRNCFDAVLCLHILEHLGRFWEILDQVKFVLKPGGFFFVAVPSLGFPKHNCPGDFWRLTEQAMCEVVMDGYDIISLEIGKSTYGKHPVIHCLGELKV